MVSFVNLTTFGSLTRIVSAILSLLRRRYAIAIATDSAKRTLSERVKMYEQRGNKVKSMTIRQPRYSKEEFAQRGDALYDSQIRSQVEEGNHGKIVAIDIETGAFEVADDLLTASKQLSSRVPDAQTWFVRIGHSAVDRFGARSLRTKR
jgi:hypothetical protein